MERGATTDTVSEIMSQFAERTGLAPGARPARRYLWTDAFAVCNFLELHRRTGDERHLQSALALVDQVHGTLGRHRENDPRTGWISGLGDEEGRAHPTRGGLRIGKSLNERGVGEPYDEHLEWERDGQYFHYLTKWMHALAAVFRATGEERFLRWGIELAQAAHAGFTHGGDGESKRMFWKMSIDLRRPLVPSMGQHDPLDGLVTFLELRAQAARARRPGDPGDLGAAIADTRLMCAGVDFTTADALGLGGLLTDAYRLAQLAARGECEEAGLFEVLLRSVHASMSLFARNDGLRGPASRRLAFRELGLAVGLHAVPRLEELLARHPARLGGRGAAAHLDGLRGAAPLAELIEDFWLDPAHRRELSWEAHRDINAVMLATSLAPDAYSSA